MSYIYTYACYENERDLCALEMRSFFGKDAEGGVIDSAVCIDPSRSPFIKGRLAVTLAAESLPELIEKVATLPATEQTFKVVFVKTGAAQNGENAFNRRVIEREIGMRINGLANLHNPNHLYGVMNWNGRWLFGDYVKSESIWFRHQQKPHSYSTALNTRIARAIVNIAIPEPTGVTAIDPCCGIGTVLVEALSMGVDIVGSDKNPLILGGTRANIAHFGYTCAVKLRDIRDITEQYDVAIIDLPYNLCSVITPKEQLELLKSARRIAKKAVIVTIEPIEEILSEAGFVIQDRAAVKKGSFTREVLVVN